MALLQADGKAEPVNLTESGYSDGHPHWVMGGRAMIFQSDRAGYRAHGGWGAERDEYIMFFDPEAYEEFRMNKEELALKKEAEEVSKAEVKHSSLRQRIKELETVLAVINGKVEEYDDALVRKLIERITVYDDHYKVEFKSGIEIEVRL